MQLACSVQRGRHLAALNVAVILTYTLYNSLVIIYTKYKCAAKPVPEGRRDQT